MDEKAESRRIMIYNFVFLNLMVFSLSSIVVMMRFKSMLEFNDFRNLLIQAVIFSFIYTLGIMYRLSYEDFVIDDFDENICKLDEYIVKSKSVIVGDFENKKIYKVKSKFSIIKLKYQVQKIDNSINLRVPLVVKKDMIKYLELK